MVVRASANVIVGAIAVLAVTATSAAIAWRASTSTIEAGFWWDDAPFVLSVDDAAKIGGPLSATELATIRTIARTDVERAFADLRIRITDDREAFWRVTVVGTPAGSPSFKYPFAAAGESHVFGPLGSWGSVGFLILAHNAIEYAPPSASRTEIVAGIGHGIGRAAVHEFAHQALGADNVSHIDNRSDEHSYEFGNADRPAQYYGDLRWTTAWPVLEQKFGRR
jgi:hypothetical protein